MSVTDETQTFSDDQTQYIESDEVNENEETDSQETEEEEDGNNPVPELQADKPNRLITEMWDNVTLGWNTLLDLKATFKNTDRPDPAILRKHLLDGHLQDGTTAVSKSQTNKAKDIAKRLSDAMAEVVKFRTELTELAFAVNGLESAGNEDDEELKEEFKATRKAVVRMFDALSMFADDRKDETLKAFLKDSLTKLPSRAIKGTSKASVAVEANAGADTSVVREWARANNYEVGDKGRIPASIVEAYNAAHPA